MSIIDDEEEMKDYGLIEIDGVNVAECDFISESNKCDVLEIFECEDYPNCYFKQLQRLKKKKEQLKEKNKKLKDEIKGMKYKDKEFIKLFKDMEKCYFSNKKLCDWQEKHINKLATALEEIQSYCSECNLKADDTACEILAIIDEVLNNVE